MFFIPYIWELQLLGISYHGTNVKSLGESRNLQGFSAIMLHAAAPGLAPGCFKRTRGRLVSWRFGVVSMYKYVNIYIYIK